MAIQFQFILFRIPIAQLSSNTGYLYKLLGLKQLDKLR